MKITTILGLFAALVGFSLTSCSCESDAAPAPAPAPSVEVPAK